MIIALVNHNRMQSAGDWPISLRLSLASGKKDITFLNFRKFEKMQIDGPGSKQNSRFLQIDGCVFTNIFVRRKNKLVISWVQELLMTPHIATKFCQNPM